MPLKFIKLFANVVDKYLTSIINYDILRSYFSDGTKKALVRSIYKKKERKIKENYHPVSILNALSSLWEVHKCQYAFYNTNLSI